MIDLQLLRNPDLVAALQDAADKKRLAFDARSLAEVFDRRRVEVRRVDDARAEQKALSSRYRSAEGAERENLKQQSGEIGTRLGELKAGLQLLEQQLQELALRAPGIPDPRAPVGDTDADNLVIRTQGDPRPMTAGMLDHVQICRRLGLVEFQRAQKFAGSRSYALIGNGMLLARAVLQLAMDILLQSRFVPVSPPVLVREEAMTGTGYFPLGVEDAYKTDREDRYLVGTSEVSLVSLHREETLEQEQLPIRYGGISLCFRREAGSHGRDTHGLYRVHQFEKVEQVSIIVADDGVSAREHELLLANSESVLHALELPYRVAIACTGEMGQGQRLKYEVETWMPSRGNFSETHSCSSFGDFQARRSDIKYRTTDGELRFAYTLNNTAVAVPRILIPLLEHHQRDDGSIRIPEALQPYLNGLPFLTAGTQPWDLLPGVRSRRSVPAGPEDDVVPARHAGAARPAGRARS